MLRANVSKDVAGLLANGLELSQAIAQVISEHPYRPIKLHVANNSYVLTSLICLR